jgi:hypothetical protein
MGDKMKHLRLLAIPAILTFQLLGQTTGTITIGGSNPEASSITNPSDTALSATVTLPPLTPTTGGTLTTSSVPMRLRSNKAYKLSAQATALSFSGAGATDGGSAITLADIGFGVTAIDATGANVATAHSDTITTKFNYSVGGFPAVTNGLTPFVAGTHGTLNDITASTQILNGTRISSKGNISTSNNFVLVTVGIATLPQYFTPNTSFSTTVTLTIATP